MALWKVSPNELFIFGGYAKILILLLWDVHSICCNKYLIKYEQEIYMGVYNGEPKSSHCKAHYYRLDAHILSYLKNETIN